MEVILIMIKVYVGFNGDAYTLWVMFLCELVGPSGKILDIKLLSQLKINQIHIDFRAKTAALTQKSKPLN